MSPSQAGPPLDPSLFAEGPMRDSRFVVKDRWVEMVNTPRPWVAAASTSKFGLNWRLTTGAAGNPCPSDPVATSTHGSTGVGWPCRRDPKRR